MTSQEQEIIELKAKIARLEAAKASKQTLSLKVSEKGGVSLYGLGRFPVTLYKSQWLKLIEALDKIKAFIAENDSKLAVKE